MKLAVDKQRRRAVDVDLPRLVHRIFNSFSRLRRGESGAKLRGVESDFVGVFEQIFLAQIVLIFEQKVVHGPEFLARRLRRERGIQGARMNVIERELAKNDGDFVAELVFQAA